MPLDGGLKLTHRDVPKLAETPYTFRQATETDLPTLMALFDAAGCELAIHTQRDEATWRYLLAHNPQSEMEAETWVVLDAQQQVVSYFRLPRSPLRRGIDGERGHRASASTSPGPPCSRLPSSQKNAIHPVSGCACRPIAT